MPSKEVLEAFDQSYKTPMPTITLGRKPDTPWAKFYVEWRAVYREMLRCWAPELGGKGS